MDRLKRETDKYVWNRQKLWACDETHSDSFVSLICYCELFFSHWKWKVLIIKYRYNIFLRFEETVVTLGSKSWEVSPYNFSVESNTFSVLSRDFFSRLSREWQIDASSSVDPYRGANLWSDNDDWGEERFHCRVLREYASSTVDTRACISPCPRLERVLL